MKYLSLRMEPNYLNALANHFAVFHKWCILFISWNVHNILVRILTANGYNDRAHYFFSPVFRLQIMLHAFV